jgi:hypothetical protein
MSISHVRGILAVISPYLLPILPVRSLRKTFREKGHKQAVSYLEKLSEPVFANVGHMLLRSFVIHDQCLFLNRTW